MPSSIVKSAEKILSRRGMEQKDESDKFQQLYDRIAAIEKAMADKTLIERKFDALLDLLKSNGNANPTHD